MLRLVVMRQRQERPRHLVPPVVPASWTWAYAVLRGQALTRITAIPARCPPRSTRPRRSRGPAAQGGPGTPHAHSVGRPSLASAKVNGEWG